MGDRCGRPEEAFLSENEPHAGGQIHPAREEDEAATVALWRACGLVTRYNDPHADFRFARAGTGSEVLVAADAAGRLVGSVMVGHDGHQGWLYYVAVDPGRRARERPRRGCAGGACARRSSWSAAAMPRWWRSTTAWASRRRSWSSCSVGSTGRDRGEARIVPNATAFPGRDGGATPPRGGPLA